MEETVTLMPTHLEAYLDRFWWEKVLDKVLKTLEYSYFPKFNILTGFGPIGQELGTHMGVYSETLYDLMDKKRRDEKRTDMAYEEFRRRYPDYPVNHITFGMAFWFYSRQ